MQFGTTTPHSFLLSVLLNARNIIKGRTFSPLALKLGSGNFAPSFEMIDTTTKLD